MSDEYERHMADHEDAPSEIKNDRENAARLSKSAQKALVKTVAGADAGSIVRRDPFDSDDVSESQELEHKGYSPVNRGALPAGVSEILKDAPTVAKTHDEVCKAHFRNDPDFPPETERQRQCMAAYREIASSLIGKPIRCERVRGSGVCGAYSDGVLKLNIDCDFIWNDPLGEAALGLIIHECAHERVAGHGVAFREECEQMGARLARWVGHHSQRWAELQVALYRPSTAKVSVD